MSHLPPTTTSLYSVMIGLFIQLTAKSLVQIYVQTFVPYQTNDSNIILCEPVRNCLQLLAEIDRSSTDQRPGFSA